MKTSDIHATGRWPETRSNLSFGLVVPDSEHKTGTNLPDFASMQAVSGIAVDSGFEALWFADHFSFPDGEGGLRGAWEVWTLLAALAATIPNVALGPMVACTGYRNPGVIAKMAEMIEEISGGRFILGLGAGWQEDEYRQFGMPMEPRYSRFEEAVTIIHGLLREGGADFQGTYYQANDAKNLPRAAVTGGIPLLFGTSGDKMLKLLARYGDAWNTGWGGNTAELAGKVARLDAACIAIGRDPASVVRTVGVTFAADGFDGDPTSVVRGSLDQQVQFVRELEAMGFRHITARLAPFSHGAVEQFATVINAFQQGS